VRTALSGTLLVVAWAPDDAWAAGGREVESLAEKKRSSPVASRPGIVIWGAKSCCRAEVSLGARANLRLNNYCRPWSIAGGCCCDLSLVSSGSWRGSAGRGWRRDWGRDLRWDGL
jgi:hypothetical protein